MSLNPDASTVSLGSMLNLSKTKASLLNGASWMASSERASFSEALSQAAQKKASAEESRAVNDKREESPRTNKQTTSNDSSPMNDSHQSRQASERSEKNHDSNTQEDIKEGVKETETAVSSSEDEAHSKTADAKRKSESSVTDVPEPVTPLETETPSLESVMAEFGLPLEEAILTLDDGTKMSLQEAFPDIAVELEGLNGEALNAALQQVIDKLSFNVNLDSATLTGLTQQLAALVKQFGAMNETSLGTGTTLGKNSQFSEWLAKLSGSELTQVHAPVEEQRIHRQGGFDLAAILSAHGGSKLLNANSENAASRASSSLAQLAAASTGTAAAPAEAGALQSRPAAQFQAMAALDGLAQKVPVGRPEWHTAMAEKILVMATQRLTSADIQLDPPELGQLQVRVTLNQEQAAVQFASPHSVVREALDQTAHRLREMFAAEGMNLVDVDVSDQSFAQGEQQSKGGGQDQGGGGDQESLMDEPVLVKTSLNLVDHFV